MYVDVWCLTTTWTNLHVRITLILSCCTWTCEIVEAVGEALPEGDLHVPRFAVVVAVGRFVRVHHQSVPNTRVLRICRTLTRIQIYPPLSEEELWVVPARSRVSRHALHSHKTWTAELKIRQEWSERARTQRHESASSSVIGERRNVSSAGR